VRTFASLRGRREFTLVIRRGHSSRSGTLTVFGYAPRQDRTGGTKLGVIIPKTVGKAVVRNRLRRRCRAIVDGAALGQPFEWYVIQCRPGAARLTYEELKTQLISVLRAARARNPRRST
jgi:ribonuclease P protein component